MVIFSVWFLFQREMDWGHSLVSSRSPNGWQKKLAAFNCLQELKFTIQKYSSIFVYLQKPKCWSGIMGSSITISWLLISPFWNIPPTSWARESEDGNNLFSCTTAWQTSYLYCERSLVNYVEHNSESFNSHRTVSDFQKISLLTALLHSSSAQQPAGEQRREEEKGVKMF